MIIENDHRKWAEKMVIGKKKWSLTEGGGVLSADWDLD